MFKSLYTTRDHTLLLFKQPISHNLLVLFYCSNSLIFQCHKIKFFYFSAVMKNKLNYKMSHSPTCCRYCCTSGMPRNNFHSARSSPTSPKYGLYRLLVSAETLLCNVTDYFLLVSFLTVEQSFIQFCI